MNDLPSSIPWSKVAYAPNRAEVEAALRENGYILVSNPFGSVFVTRENRNHPEYKLSEAYAREKESERLEEAHLSALCANIITFIRVGKYDKAQGTLYAHEVMKLSGASLSECQNVLIQFFQDNMMYTDLGGCYAQFRAFCKLGDIPVDNNKLGEFAPFHDNWYAKEKATVKEQAIRTSLDEALDAGNHTLAAEIVRRSHGVDYSKAYEMVKNMIKLRELKKITAAKA